MDISSYSLILSCKIEALKLLLGGFYGISTTVGYLMPILWNINHCRLFNANSSLSIYDLYDLIISLVWFYTISTIVGYLAPSPHYLYIYI